MKDIQIPQGQDLIDAILKLKKKKKCRDFGALLSAKEKFKILQIIWEILLQLARAAKDTDADMIAFVGAFYGRSGKILNLCKKVVLPDTLAGCSLADGCSGEGLENA